MCLPEDFTLFDRSVHILNHKSFARYSECNRSLISSETNDTASLIPYPIGYNIDVLRKILINKWISWEIDLTLMLLSLQLST